MIEVGQVLSLRIRFNNSGTVSATKHPYLVMAVHDDLGVVEVGQIDSLNGKYHKAAMRCNKTIFCDEPIETVIDKDSYIQLDNRIMIENFTGLEKYRRQTDKLSPIKLRDVLTAYAKYQARYGIDENKNVYMDQAEIESLNT